MKKRLTAVVITVMMLFGTAFLTSCGEKDVKPTSGSSNGKSAYDLAVENGYKGTVKEWLASLAGENGEVGEKGERGESAYELAVKNGYKGTEKQWLASLIEQGKSGADGKNGTNGKSAYELAVANGYTGTESEWLKSFAGSQGEKGAKGDTGDNGKSAYELAVENGYTGTLSEWIDSLSHGPKGDKGDSGAAGKTAYELACDNGFVGTLSQWLTSLVGAQGEKGTEGAKGADGKSAYDLAKDTGYTGSLTEWLATLVGAKGDDGDAGKSAYELACDNGETRTLQEWLKSLVGKDAYGVAVANGYTGTVEEWLFSLRGADGVSITSVALDANGHLLVFLSDRATALDVGKVVGEKGENGTDGNDGVGIVGASITDGSLYLNLSNNTKICAGALPKGEKGDTGVGIANAVIDSNGHLILTLTDGSTKDAGKVTADGGSTAPTTFTVTFKDWDGTVLKTQKVNAGSSATAPADPTRNGYTFSGWDKKFNNITADTVITATYTEITDPTIIVESCTAESGGVVNMTVRIKNNPGIAGAILTLSYNSKLTLNSATSGEAFSSFVYTRPGQLANPCNFSWDSESGMITDDGVILNLQFSVSSSAQQGENLNVSLSYINGNIYDENLNDVNINIVNGNIKIK